MLLHKLLQHRALRAVAVVLERAKSGSGKCDGVVPRVEGQARDDGETAAGLTLARM